jgi:integral membrane sensor domain MASE1
VVFGFSGGGLLVGFIFRWWGLFASVGFACFLAYALEFSGEGILYALIVGMVSSVAITGTLTRRRLRP